LGVEFLELRVDRTFMSGSVASLHLVGKRLPARVLPQGVEVGVGGDTVGVAIAAGGGLFEIAEGAFLVAGLGSTPGGAGQGTSRLAIEGGSLGGSGELLLAVGPIGFLVGVGGLVCAAAPPARSRQMRADSSV
jgi:hypothetical protein